MKRAAKKSPKNSKPGDIIIDPEASPPKKGEVVVVAETLSRVFSAMGEAVLEGKSLKDALLEAAALASSSSDPKN